MTMGAGPNPNPGGVRIEGVIGAIDPGSQQLLVGDVTVQVTPNTIITMGSEEILFDDLAVGMTVVVCGKVEGDLLFAHKITVKYKGK